MIYFLALGGGYIIFYNSCPLSDTSIVCENASIAWFPLVLRIVRIGDFYDIPTSGILTTSGNTSSQKSQTVGDFYDVIGRIGIISTLKVLSQTSQMSAIFTMSVNLAVLRIAIVVRIPVSGNRKNPRFLRFLGQVGTRLYKQLNFLLISTTSFLSHSFEL